MIQDYIHNENIQLAFVGLLFIIWVFLIGNSCPCGYKNIKTSAGCYRFEIMGVQPNHFYFFMFLGYFFSKYFYLI